MQLYLSVVCTCVCMCVCVCVCVCLYVCIYRKENLRTVTMLFSCIPQRRFTKLKCTTLEWPAIPCFVKICYISKLKMGHTYIQTSYWSHTLMSVSCTEERSASEQFWMFGCLERTVMRGISNRQLLWTLCRKESETNTYSTTNKGNKMALVWRNTTSTRRCNRQTRIGLEPSGYKEEG